jgi:hypothetical protein
MRTASSRVTTAAILVAGVAALVVAGRLVGTAPSAGRPATSAATSSPAATATTVAAVEVPDVFGRTLAQAKTVLRAAGLLGAADERDPQVPGAVVMVQQPATTDQVTNVPTWLWIDPATWGVRTATASVPNESATVTATPVSVTWTMGDGSRVVCRGPGTPYTGGDPARPSPDCGHTYRQSSAGQPGLRYPVTATTTWRITWVASGVVAASGSLAPLLRTSTTSLRVAEAQTVN